MIKAIKGTSDILPPESKRWSSVEKIAREILELYGFAEIRTPIFEATELFARGVGEETDIVSKEMYTFDDRDDHSLTLRPEGTAPVVRAAIEHHLLQESQLLKLYYLGPMFRRERPQKGRYRQFHQIGAEVLGSDNPAIEAEVLEMLDLFLNRIGLREYNLLVNSIGCSLCRPKYLAVLSEAIQKNADSLCPDCRRRMRTNPLRVLDCKVESCQPTIDALPAIADYLDEGCRTHFQKFLSYLQERKIQYKIVPRLVRGLDYYTRTTFEMTSEALGAQNTLIGGGRYDGLSEMLGGAPSKGFGFALGLERILLILDQLQPSFDGYSPLLFLAPLGEAAFERATELARYFRQQELSCGLDFETRSLKSSMRLANKIAARYVLILGDEELRTGRYALKRMSDGFQQLLVPEEIAAFLKADQRP
ncbi:MAG: histidine--tRNA ligase [Terriglobia bacterium]